MSFKILFFTALLVHCVLINGGQVVKKQQFHRYLGDSCRLIDRSIGICQKTEDCKGSVKEYLHQKKFSEITLCAFDKDKPVLCCENIIEVLPPPSQLVTPFQKLLCENSPKTPRLSKNIVGGDLTEPREFPHQVAIGYQQDSQSPIEFKCGGSLISDRLVLTAAHCVNIESPKIVRLGRVSLVPDVYDYAPIVDKRVQKINIHPNYSRGTRLNDIALIHLSKVVKFSDHIQPICLSGPRDLTHKNMTVTGFGTINTDTNKRSDWLRKAVIKGTPFDKCKATIRELDDSLDINDTQFCALGKNNEDACKGDSGGPVIHDEDNQHQLYGIVSFSIGCGGIPAVYTKVDKFHEWIESQMK
ncbi:unnamed protein product [Chironomus riparius]|uniref:Peptidase S1 domain-containing protein n=1 Tax=Chironomus riparius TaxID=315576 RepID=A0A9N9WJV7_9DIPT|nr:unnamed protein product [Chironomus riparius]